MKPTAEEVRLEEDTRRVRHWKRWGTYLSERQWGTVREDYSPNGDVWRHFTHEQARSRVYRWGEDGLLGWTDRGCRLCFSVALWNGEDRMLKERLFGLTGPEGNHGEDVKELYFYLDATPTQSWAHLRYKYPQTRFPYEELLAENQRRGRHELEYDLQDTGIFDQSRYFDVDACYAKAAADDTCILLTIHNRGPERRSIVVLPQLWFRNTWSWGRTGDGHTSRPELHAASEHAVAAEHESLGSMRWLVDPTNPGFERLLFTDNEPNDERLWGVPNKAPYVKDAFHDWLIEGRTDAVNPELRGTKVGALHRLTLDAGESVTLRLRLVAAQHQPARPFGPDFAATVALRRAEADAFYARVLPSALTPEERLVARQSHAGLVFTRQFYHYTVSEWLDGDPAQLAPPEARLSGRNAHWRHLFNRDVISMPDKWEYPWYAAWDLAFHVVPFASIDPDFAKEQLLLFLREWYMHPNGQLPAYEFKLEDVNPPVHAWGAWVVYKQGLSRGKPDLPFLQRVFHKLLLNFNWWVNRKDEEGNNLFAGGFLGLDNIGVFDRSQPLPGGGRLEQADGTAWMAFFCATMLQIALELARHDAVYEDLASKFFEHFIGIADAINTMGGDGLWDELDGFYYDQLHLPNGRTVAMRTRSLVGIMPICAVDVIDDATLELLPGFAKRMDWFLRNRPELATRSSYCGRRGGKRLLAVPSEARLRRVLATLLDERELLSQFGIRSLSKRHQIQPFVLELGGQQHRVDYVPGESNTGMFGGNSNWRGPIWFPINYLIIEALLKYHGYYGDSFRVECPTGSGNLLTLDQIAVELARRLTTLFLPDARGRRPCHGSDPRWAVDPAFRELVLFYEHFHGDDGRGLGASHQTGWTALVTSCLELVANRRVGDDD